MKKYISLLMLAGLLLSFGVAKAEENGSDDMKRPAMTGEMKQKREEWRKEMQTEREAFVAKLKADREKFTTELKTKREEFRKLGEDMRNKFLGNAREMIGKRFEMAITGLEKIQSRVGEAITKLKDDGKDTAAATVALNTSKEKLADAKAKINEIKDLLPEKGTEMTAEVFEKVKLLAREAKDLLKESKEYLRDSIEEVKGLKGEDKDNDSDE